MVREDALTRFAWLSIAAALTTFTLKAVAYLVTGSVGLLSDAFESTVNLVAAIVALLALRLAARPPDHNHQFGHGKVEYLSAGVEGGMIFAVALAIAVTAVPRLLEPRELEALGLGLAVSAVASAINLAVGLVLVRAGRRHHSLTLSADGQHLLADVWTTAGVFVGVIAAQATGWERLDPVVALLVAVNIMVTGVRLMRRSTAGLMDEALPEGEHAAIDGVLDGYRAQGVEFHALRTGEAGSWRIVTVHVLVPGAWSVQRGHDLVEQIEADLGRAVPGAAVFTHLEPVEDPVSWEDVELGPR
ncbi:MAG: cation diffusion facilitator family transporter [Acidimicrobiia bacterium]|nr:cation diffusion facilitator family transporter [Acidimicrobiia bacterium]